MSNLYTQQVIEQIRNHISGSYILGDAKFIELLLVAFFSNGHVLIEGPPGTAKTTTAKVLAALLSKEFKRVQFTTDLLPGDILGAHVFSPAQQTFSFMKGPIFSDFVVADEINRAPPRTQSALLEAMEERQVTIEGRQYALPPHFFVVATQNPQDHEGTFPLPEVQLDRFLFKLKVHHSNPTVESQLLRKVLDGSLPPVFSKITPLKVDFDKIQAELATITIDESILKYITKILQNTRGHSLLSLGSSIRGGIAIAKTSRILAAIHGRNFVTPDDIKYLTPIALRHRIKLNPEAQVGGTTEDDVLQDIVSKVEFPK